MPLHVWTDDGRELDASFSIAEVDSRRSELTLESRGGAQRADGNARNSEYSVGLLVLLQRLASLDCIIDRVVLASAGAASRLRGDDPTLELKGFPYPIQDLGRHDLPRLRTAIQQAARTKGQREGAIGGNRTKRITISVSLPEGLPVRSGSFVEAISGAPSADEAAANGKYAPLGAFLATQGGEVRLTLDALEKLLGPLPAAAYTHQFWANARDHHWSRRRHWLERGFNAFYEPRQQAVRFERRDDDRLALGLPTSDPLELETRVAALMARPMSELRPPAAAPPGPAASVLREVLGFVRDPRVVAYVLQRASGRCECCANDAPFRRPDGRPFLEVHHVLPLADGGPDCIENAVAVCPNCHRELHHGSERQVALNRLFASVIELRRFDGQVAS